MSYKKRAFYEVFTIIFGMLALAIAGAFLVNIIYYLILANFNFQDPLSDLMKAKGQFVNVDGNRMHLYCTGEGDDVAILEADQKNWSIYWDTVQQEVSKFSKVCSYDRLGRGWSSGSVQNYSDDLNTLHKLLEAANLPGPYILVGHKWGAENMMRYYGLYPEDVKGIVLYDYDWKKEEALMNAYKNDQMNVPLVGIASDIKGLPELEQAKLDDVRVRLGYHIQDWQPDSAFIVVDDTKNSVTTQAISQAIKLLDNL